MPGRTRQDDDERVDAWINQNRLDPNLSWFDVLASRDIPGDMRPRCEALTAATPGYKPYEVAGHLCRYLAKDGTPFCRVHKNRH